MSYKPKFCCECGEKIERVDWKPWTSRRFCPLCATEYGLGEKLQLGLIVVGLLFGVVGLGVFWQKTEKSSNAASNLISKDASNKNKAEINRTIQAPAATENSSVQPLPQIQTTNSALETQTKTQISSPNLQIKQSQLDQKNLTQNEPVYFCGAQTKKGTACSRRVKGGGRCWQHVGQSAMLPQEKLIVSNN